MSVWIFVDSGASIVKMLLGQFLELSLESCEQQLSSGVHFKSIVKIKVNGKRELNVLPTLGTSTRYLIQRRLELNPKTFSNY